MEFSDDLDEYLSATRKRLTQTSSNDIFNDTNQTNDYERYLYNSERDLWYDTMTDTYSKYDAQRQCYIPVSFHSYQTDETPEDTTDEPDSDASCRLVVIASTVVPVGQVILMDANGLTIGRDKKEWDTRRIRLRDMQVSKYHCQLFYDQDQHRFAITDVGSQNGTLLNGERLSPAKTSSRPFPLKNGDELTLGLTVLKVHQHDHGWPCNQCQTSAVATTTKAATAPKPTMDQKPQISKKQWQKQLLQKYDDQDPPPQQKYVDRAQLRRERDPESNDRYHHQPNESIDLTTPVQGKGYDMLQKMGWQTGQGIGVHQQGITEPLAPISTPYERAGLGAQHLSKKDWQYQQMKQRYKQV